MLFFVGKLQHPDDTDSTVNAINQSIDEFWGKYYLHICSLDELVIFYSSERQYIFWDDTSMGLRKTNAQAALGIQGTVEHVGVKSWVDAIILGEIAKLQQELAVAQQQLLTAGIKPLWK